MVGIYALDKRNGLRQDRNITLNDTLNHLTDRQFATTEAIALKVGVNDRGLLYPTVHLQACIF
jgi:hypothetical protein